MRFRLVFLAGGLAVAAAALHRLRGRRAPALPAPGADDSRAEALRRKLAESREVVGEQDEFEAAETPIDAVEDVEEQRRAVHERGRGVVDDMLRGDA